jgi:hypothetical protein
MASTTSHPVAAAAAFERKEIDAIKAQYTAKWSTEQTALRARLIETGNTHHRPKLLIRSSASTITNNLITCNLFGR